MTTSPAQSEHGFVDPAGLALVVDQGLWRLPDVDVGVLVQVLRKHGIRFVVVFGSVATGRVGRSSDLDMGYLASGARRINPLKLFADLNRALLSDRLDLVNLNRASPLLAREVARDGRLLWAEDPNEWTEYRQRAWKEWDDVQRLEEYRVRSVRQWLARRKLDG